MESLKKQQQKQQQNIEDNKRWASDSRKSLDWTGIRPGQFCVSDVAQVFSVLYLCPI